MEVRTLVASLHTATTAAGNGNSASNPTGGGLIAGTLTGSGYVTAVCVLEASVAGSVWVPLAEPVEFRGHGIVEVEHYYSATAPLVRLRVIRITGTLAVGVYRVEERPDEQISQRPDGTLVTTDPIVAPNLGSATGRWGSCRIPQRMTPYQALNNPGNELSSGWTVMIRRPAPIKQSEGRVYGLQLVLENWNTAAPMVVAGAKVGSQPVFVGGHANLPVATATLSWGGSAGVSVAAGAVLAGGTAGGDDNPGVAVSDYVHLLDTPRTDGGEYALYDFRILTGGSFFFAARPAAQPTGIGSVEVSDRWTGADRFTVWDAYVGDSKPYECAPAMWVIWYTSKGKIVADILGDSIMGGAATVGSRRSLPAVALESLGIAHNVVAHPAQIYASLSKILARDTGKSVLSGKIAVLNVCSAVNDGANALKSLHLFADNVERMRARGVLPIIIGPTPYDTALMPDILAFLSSCGYPWFDPIPYMGDDSRHFKAGYSGDAIHPNDTAVDATYPALAEFIRQQLLSAGF